MTCLVICTGRDSTASWSEPHRLSQVVFLTGDVWNAEAQGLFRSCRQAAARKSLQSRGGVASDPASVRGFSDLSRGDV
jgi:hypothetical protein